MGKEYYQFIVTSSEIYGWHLIFNNPDYTKKVLSKTYWDAYNKLHPKPNPVDNELWIFLVIGIAVGIVLSGVIIIILCIARGDRTQTDYVRNHYLKQGYIMVRAAY